MLESGRARGNFAERLPGLADRLARRTLRQADIIHLLGTGERPAERIL